jgi:aspartate/methionine/tyrosine aminotransferase
MGFLNAVLAVADPGDDILLLAPFYFNHEMAVRIAGCRPVVVPTSPEYQPDPDRIAEAVTPRTRAVVTVSPNNPTGATYPAGVLRDINRLCGERGLFHIHDEAYEYFRYDGASSGSVGAGTGAPRYTISLYSLSKSYGMAGWRIGYMAIPASLRVAVQKIQDTNLICPPRICQAAACAALDVGRVWCEAHLPALAEVREDVLQALSGLGDRIEAPRPSGAFYVLIRLRTAQDDMSVVRYLIEKHRVAVIPGRTFGVVEGCALRIAFGALQADTVREAMSRLAEGLNQIC